VKRKQINGTLRITIMIVLTVLLGISSLYTFTVYRKPAVQKVQVPTYQLNQAGTADYRVRLKPNNLYPKLVLDSGKIYVANFVDKIDVDFKYMFKNQVMTRVSGTYTISAVLEAYQQLNQEPGKEKSVKIWEKEFVLAQPGKFQFEAKDGEFKKTVSVDYLFFDRFMDAVNKVAETNTGEARLLVKCNMLLEASTPKGINKQVITPAIMVPVGPKVFEIEGAKASEKPIVINDTKTVIKPEVRREKVVFGSVTAALFVVLLVLLLATRPVTQNLKTKMMARINKKYGDRIVNITVGDFPKTDKIVVIDSMDGLVKVADELAKPIFRNEQAEGGNHIYYVFDGLICYQCEIRFAVLFSSVKNSEHTVPLQY